MELTDKQKKIYKGLVCPYCGNETELVEAGSVYGSGWNGKIRLCRPCNAWVGCHKREPMAGVALGSVAKFNLRWDRHAVHCILDRMWTTKEERKDLYKDLSEYLGIPLEYTHIGMFREKTLVKVLEFCLERKKDFGIKLQKVNANETPESLGKWLYCDGVCRGCPSKVLRSIDDPIYCDDDMVYQNLNYSKKIEIEKKKGELNCG